jgi:DNA-binding transcriptional MerR regulator
MGAMLTIGQVARLAGVTPDTIRYYERLGVMPRPPRTPAGYRQYQTGIVDRLRTVRNAQQFGFSLKDLARFMRARETGGRPCHDVRDAAQRMLEAVDQQISELTLARRDMRRTLQAWDRKLAATPDSQPAHLLEDLGGRPVSRRPARMVGGRRP